MVRLVIGCRFLKGGEMKMSDVLVLSMISWVLTVVIGIIIQVRNSNNLKESSSFSYTSECQDGPGGDDCSSGHCCCCDHDH